jgi:hypothetical protein
MIGRWCLFFVCCLNTLPAVAFGPSGQWVTPDERPPLVWQQVQDLHWDSGASRSTVDGGGAYVLPGGGSARFLIEEGRYVRLQPANADGVAPGVLDTLETLQSRDGAWFYPIAMSGAGPEGDVVSLRPVAADRVIWLRNNGEKSLRVKVFEGRYAAPPTEVTWQPQTLAELPLTTLRQYPQSELQHYHPLQHTIPHRFTLEGPGLYALTFRETHNQLPRSRRVRIAVALDEQPSEVSYLHFTTDRRHRYQQEENRLLLSLAERHYLWIPAGEHQVSLNSDHSLWFRLLEAKSDRSTSSGSAWSWEQTRAVLRDRLLFQQQQTQWAIDKVLGQGAGAAELAAASFDSEEVSGWQAGDPGNLFRRRYTQSRTLWPAEGSMQYRVIPLATELNLTARDRWEFSSPEPAGDPVQTFFRVAREPLTLAVPFTPGPTNLELTLTQPEQPTTLMVGYAGNEATLRFQPQAKLDAPQLRLSASAQQQRQQASSAPEQTVSKVWLPLPEGVEKVQIQAIEGTADVRATVDEGRWPALTEQEFEDQLNSVGADTLPDNWQEYASQFVRDWLYSRYHNFVDDLSPAFSTHAPAKAKENLDALRAGAEPELTRRYAEGLFVYSEDAEVRNQAFRFLRQTHIQQNDEYGLQSLLATAFLHHRQTSVLPDLALALERGGYDNEALKLALVLLESNQLPLRRQEMRDLALRSAVLSDWPLTLHELTRDLPEAEQRGWRRLYLREHYDPEDSEAALPTFHPILDFAEGLPSPDRVTASEWLQAFGRDYPGRWRWRDWHSGYEDEVAQVNVHNPDLNRFYQRQRVSPETPLVLNVTGPAQLRVSLSLLHNNRESRLSDSLGITHNGNGYRFPIIDSGVFNRHRIIGADNEFPGRVEQVEISLGPGEHRLEMAPERRSALMQVELNTPQFLARSYLWAQNRVCVRTTSGWPQGTGQRPAPASLPIVSPDWATNLMPNTEQCQSFSTGATDPGPTVRFEPAPLPEYARDLNPDPAGHPSHDKVSQYLSQALQTPGFARRPELIARSNALAAVYPDSPIIRQRLAAVNAEHGWEQEELILDSAGILRFDSTEWPPATPFLKNRYALLGQTPTAAEQLLSGLEPIVIAVDNEQSREYRLRLRMDKVGFERVSPVALDVRIDGEPYSRVRLDEARPGRTLRPHLPRGTSQLELQLIKPTSRHWVHVQLEQRRGPEERWQPVVREQTRTYYSVLPGQPLKLYVDQPAWLRLEVFDGQQRMQQYVYHPDAGNLILDAKDLKGPYVRVYSLRHQPGRLKALPPSSTPALVLSKKAPLQHSNAATPSAFLSDGIAIPAREGGTHGGYGEWVQRRNFDGISDLESERYLELGWRYQQNPRFSRFYWQSDVFLRRHTTEDISLLGSQQWLTWRPDNRHWRLTLSAGGFWQPAESAASLKGRVQLNGYMPLSDDLAWEHELSGFASWLSESSNPSAEGYDDDVFTRYTSDHQYGVEWQESLSYRPRRDSRLRLDASVRTNENLGPDRFGLGLRWDQFWLRQTRTYLSVEQRWFQADGDRSQQASQQLIGAGVDWHLWRSRGQRWFVGLGAGLDLDSSEPALKLTVGSDAPGARRLEDFRRERFPFFELQEINAARSVDTNELNYVE